MTMRIFCFMQMRPVGGCGHGSVPGDFDDDVVADATLIDAVPAHPEQAGKVDFTTIMSLPLMK